MWSREMGTTAKQLDPVCATVTLLKINFKQCNSNEEMLNEAKAWTTRPGQISEAEAFFRGQGWIIVVKIKKIIKIV